MYKIRTVERRERNQITQNFPYFSEFELNGKIEFRVNRMSVLFPGSPVRHGTNNTDDFMVEVFYFWGRIV